MKNIKIKIDVQKEEPRVYRKIDKDVLTPSNSCFYPLLSHDLNFNNYLLMKRYFYFF